MAFGNRCFWRLLAFEEGVSVERDPSVSEFSPLRQRKEEFGVMKCALLFITQVVTGVSGGGRGWGIGGRPRGQRLAAATHCADVCPGTAGSDCLVGAPRLRFGCCSLSNRTAVSDGGGDGRRWMLRARGGPWRLCFLSSPPHFNLHPPLHPLPYSTHTIASPPTPLLLPHSPSPLDFALRSSLLYPCHSLPYPLDSVPISPRSLPSLYPYCLTPPHPYPLLLLPLYTHSPCFFYSPLPLPTLYSLSPFLPHIILLPPLPNTPLFSSPFNTPFPPFMHPLPLPFYTPLLLILPTACSPPFNPPVSLPHPSYSPLSHPRPSYSPLSHSHPTHHPLPSPSPLQYLSSPYNTLSPPLYPPLLPPTLTPLPHPLYSPSPSLPPPSSVAASAL
ncbi:hypothetical protein C7M84_001233 [Penaeus vannamei]|uniref:Uncharacterized protein n=1 Tax=Penaeus vannamei TaxID=6689 RepID=A0A423TU93_PENVA|nr:hypothetical protein C7M84_001233 [Penaeus vannamei]